MFYGFLKMDGTDKCLFLACDGSKYYLTGNNCSPHIVKYATDLSRTVEFCKSAFENPPDNDFIKRFLRDNDCQGICTIISNPNGYIHAICELSSYHDFYDDEEEENEEEDYSDPEIEESFVSDPETGEVISPENPDSISCAPSYNQVDFSSTNFTTNLTSYYIFRDNTGAQRG